MHEKAKNLESLLIREPTKVIKLFQLVRNYCASSIFLQRVKGMHDKLKAQAALQVACASNTGAAASAKANVPGLPKSPNAADVLPPGAKRAGSGTRTTFIDNANAALKEKERVKAAADAAKAVAAAADAAKEVADSAKAVKAAAKAAAALKAKEAKASSQASKKQRNTPSTRPPARKNNLRPPALGTVVLDDEVSHYYFFIIPNTLLKAMLF